MHHALKTLVFQYYISIMNHTTIQQVTDNVYLVASILEYLTIDDICECAMVSQLFFWARNLERVNPTTTGIITFKTPIQHVSHDTWRHWNEEIFIKNRTRLVAVFETLVQDDNAESFCKKDLPFELTNVQHVVLQRHESVQVPTSIVEQDFGAGTCAFVKAVTPNIETFDVGHFAKSTRDGGTLNSREGGHMSGLGIREFRSLLATTGQQRNVMTARACFFDRDFDRENAEKLTEFHVDNFSFIPFFATKSAFPTMCFPPISAYCKEEHEYEKEEWFRGSSICNSYGEEELEVTYWGGDRIILQEFTNLECVTLGNASYWETCDGAYVELSSSSFDTPQHFVGSVAL